MPSATADRRCTDGSPTMRSPEQGDQIKAPAAEAPPTQRDLLADAVVTISSFEKMAAHRLLKIIGDR